MEMSRRYLDDAAFVMEIHRIVDSNFKERAQSGARQPGTPRQVAARFEYFERLAESLTQASLTLGQVPAGPATLRAKFGGAVIRSLQRILFWYTLQIQGFHALVADAFQQFLSEIKSLHAQNTMLHQQLEELRTHVDNELADFQRQLAQLRASAALAQRVESVDEADSYSASDAQSQNAAKGRNDNRLQARQAHAGLAALSANMDRESGNRIEET